MQSNNRIVDVFDRPALVFVAPNRDEAEFQGNFFLGMKRKNMLEEQILPQMLVPWLLPMKQLVKSNDDTDK